jgi:hypothetical protein
LVFFGELGLVLGQLFFDVGQVTLNFLGVEVVFLAGLGAKLGAVTCDQGAADQLSAWRAARWSGTLF